MSPLSPGQDTSLTSAPAPSTLLPWLLRRRGGPQLGLLLAVVAIAVGVLVQSPSIEHLLEEGGFVESATLWLYMAAVLTLLIGGRAVLPLADIGAGSVLLLAMAAREADLHKELVGTSILKMRFYLNGPALGQLALAAAVLVPIALSGLWLLRRHGRRWLTAPLRWTPAMVTLFTMGVALVFAKIMDRTPATLGELGLLRSVPEVVVHVMLALEEILELGLPLFAILALLQGRAQARPQPA